MPGKRPAELGSSRDSDPCPGPAASRVRLLADRRDHRGEPVSSLFRVHSDLTFLFRPSRADPYDAAGNGVEGVIRWNNLDGLSAFQFAEISAQSEAVRRAIDNQARKSLGLPSNVSDNASASCPDHSLRTAAVGGAKGHRFRSSLKIPGSHIALGGKDKQSGNRGILW